MPSTSSYSIPPWIGQPADPAAHYSQGMQLGLRMGAEQAANFFKQQQLAREQQKNEFEAQLKAQERDLEIDQITRKHKAIADYQSMVGQGMDPMQALQQVGPDIGVDPSHVAMVMEQKAQHAAQRQQQGAMLDLRMTEEERRQAGEERRQAHEESLAQNRQRNMDLKSRQIALKENAPPKMSAQDRMALQALYRELATVNTALMKANTAYEADPGNAPPRNLLLARKFAIGNEINRLSGKSSDNQDVKSMDTGDESNVDSETDNQPDEGESDAAPDTTPQESNWKTVGNWKIRAK